MKIILIALMLMTQACSTIYYHNGGSSQTVTREEWHHDGIIRLVEFSDPVDMNKRCAGSTFTTIKTEKNFLQSVASAFSFGLYDPWDVSYSCVRYPASTTKSAGVMAEGTTAMPKKAAPKKKK